MAKPAANPAMIAAASELALASATIRDTNSGAAGLRPRCPAIRAFRSRPVHASATAAISSAGTPVQGSGGSRWYTNRSSSQPAAAPTTATTASVDTRVGFMASLPLVSGPLVSGPLVSGPLVSGPLTWQPRGPGRA